MIVADITLDFGSDAEVSGVRIFNAAGAAGALLIGFSLQVITASGTVVFSVPITDNRLVYNIRTCPPTAADKTAATIRMREVISVPGRGCCGCSGNVRRGQYINDQNRAVMVQARTQPQYTTVVFVDYSTPYHPGGHFSGCAIICYIFRFRQCMLQ